MASLSPRACALLLIALAVIPLPSAGGVAASAPDEPKGVLVLFSFRHGLTGNALANRNERLLGEVRSVLDSLSTEDIRIHVAYLERSDLPEPVYFEKAADDLRGAYSHSNISVVLAVNFRVLDFLLRHGESAFPGSAIVFSGVEMGRLRGREIGANVTGAAGRAPIEETTSAILRILPDTKRVFVIVGTSETDRFVESVAREQLRPYEGTVEVTFPTDRSVNGLSAQVAALPENSVVLFLTLLRAGPGDTVVPSNVGAMLASASSAPVFGMFEGLIGRGIVGGSMALARGQGRAVARQIRRILDGERPADIPIVQTLASQLMFDARELKRWGIPEDRLPPGSIVRFGRPSIWASYKWPIVGALAFGIGQSLLIGGLLVSRRMRRRVERSLEAALKDVSGLQKRLEQENLYLREEITATHGFAEIVGESEAIHRALHRVEQVAKTESSALILGETGTGKELVARAIHDRSPRRERPLVKINCAALPETLIESELFGHEKGAFTGADARRPGRFELADGGTLFLDEIGDLSAVLQTKLLRVLQEGEFERVGGTQTLRVDVRIITATNRDLPRAIAEGRFRSDLFYRLNVFPIELPPLRQRREDIPLLVWYFAERMAKNAGKHFEAIPAPLMDGLVSYDWPGNVRELHNVVERAVVVSPGPVLLVDEVLATGAAGVVPPKEAASNSSETGPASDTLKDAERRHILGVLNRCGWKVRGPGGAAEALGLKESTLRTQMKRLGIRRPPDPGPGSGRTVSSSRRP